MCTALTFVKETLFFGRNMDIDYDFGQQIAVMPREYPLKTKKAGILLSHYATVGTARVEDGYPLYAEACNEKGLCMAGLNFPFNAVYAEKAEKDKTALAPYELIPYVLGRCADLEEAKELLKNTEIVAERFKAELPLAPLHWIVADKTGSVVAERTADGLSVYDNPFGVLTNNPPFPEQVRNAEQISKFSVSNPKDAFSSDKSISGFCEGAGATGLPGDFSSPSRFVKAAFCLRHSVCDGGTEKCVAQTMRLLDAVSMPRGIVVTAAGRNDITVYSCCIDAENGAYYYKTYDGLNVKCVKLTQDNATGEEIYVYEMS